METGGSNLTLQRKTCNCKDTPKIFRVIFPIDNTEGTICDVCFSDKKVMRGATEAYDIRTQKEISVN